MAKRKRKSQNPGESLLPTGRFVKAEMIRRNANGTISVVISGKKKAAPKTKRRKKANPKRRPAMKKRQAVKRKPVKRAKAKPNKRRTRR